MLPQRTDVLVVGAGPTGLALAVSLQQAGVDHVLIDKLGQGHNTSRAAAVHAHTLEMLDRLGVAAPLLMKGLTVERFLVRDRDRALLQVGFDSLPSAFRHVLLVPQCETEALLRNRLVELGGCVHEMVLAVRAEARHDGAIVTVTTANGEQPIHARYVVGGDGMHSVVRKAAGIAFEGEGREGSFMLADVQMDWPLGTGEVSLFFSPAGVLVVAPLPGGTFRVVATLSEAPEQPTVGDVQKLLDERGPLRRTATVSQVVWGSRFRIHHRLVGTYRAGPFLLMGDAAHVHSPAGGQGMNTGLVDAVVLGEALARVIQDKEAVALLDVYGTMRRPAAAQVLKLAARLTRVATLRSGLLRTVRNYMLRLLDTVPLFKRNLAMALSGLSRRKLSNLPSRNEIANRRPRTSGVAAAREASPAA